jgi:EAL domain-containing protein (putative c-di-GMP-specific phosphodiesterase class I)
MPLTQAALWLAESRHGAPPGFLRATETPSPARDGWDGALSIVALARELREGIARQEIVPFYQPILSLGSGALLGFESLARWHHPRLGTLAPSLFIPLAEGIGAIADLSFALLARIGRDTRDWPDHLTLSINISPIQLRDADLPLHLLGLLHDGGIAPERLIVELTESGPVGDLATAQQILSALREAGVRVALDDFGAGSASLRRLSELPFDGLKIDRSFVGALGSRNGRTIVRSIVGLARSLGMISTIEGIESPEQAELLAELGCDCGQGYLFGRAMPATAALRMIVGGGEYCRAGL